jgi:hypothetical protein
MASTSARRRTEPAGPLPEAHRLLALLFLAGGVVQFFLAGLATFGGSGFEPHRILGDVLTAVSLLILILAFVGRREAVQASAVLFGLMVVQEILGAWLGDEVPVLGALHPVVGLAVLGVAMLTAAGSRVRFGPPHGAG